MKLRDLDPRLEPMPPHGGHVYQTLTFRCPVCRKGAVQVKIWGGKAGDLILKTGEPPVRLWHAEQGPEGDWESLTITPSINCDNQPHKRHDGSICPGWHSFITNGEIK